MRVDLPRLEHVRVNVSDFDRSVAWYESILELPALSHWPPDAPQYCHFQTGPTQFALSVLDPVPAAGRYNFSVADVDKVVGEARATEQTWSSRSTTRLTERESSPSRTRTATSSASCARTEALPFRAHVSLFVCSSSRSVDQHATPMTATSRANPATPVFMRVYLPRSGTARRAGPNPTGGDMRRIAQAAIGVGAVTSIVIAGTTYAAATGDPDPRVYACVQVKTGDPRIVLPNTTCKKDEALVELGGPRTCGSAGRQG